MQTTKQLTIFEGPDGSGKSTAAKQFAKDTNAVYVHFDQFKHVESGLARLYVEAMLPALLGYQNVVFDRCWLSEIPYGITYRGGQNRLGPDYTRMLERLAYRCGAVVVRCNPGWEAVKESFLKRKGDEMLNNLDELQTVYEIYTQDYFTELPLVEFDYLAANPYAYRTHIERKRGLCHRLDVRSAGNLGGAKYVLVGDSFADHKNLDPLYQWPFASFSTLGCSQWFTHQLKLRGIPESQLLWVNADQDLEFLYDLIEYTSVRHNQIFALGKKAEAALYKLKINAIAVDHPQHHKRFKCDQRYPLFDYIGN